ncbi:hypothetical protein PRIPAC_83257 [Pristionchus pacificus]|uniref:Uncharacterized protein n=1 Tax=Pristionchus pacificus TaxID=54126 RepID=A0A2A6BSI2_PRIPA|nr:hypothetical protein PRIPAC_83257 [Pristionchus pacificus]|eukprot:PDM68827.1 hypothetical protein PRIPAC_47129 [Pristionchus pacificus]
MNECMHLYNFSFHTDIAASFTTLRHILQMSAENRAYASIVRALEVLNKSGKYRAALVTASVKRYPEIVLHGDVDVVRGLACSNMQETIGIISDDHLTVTLPLVDFSAVLEDGTGDDLVRAVTDGLEAESRPRRNLFQREKDNALPPPHWPSSVTFASLNSGNRKKYAREVLQHMQQYKEERWDDIMNGRNVHKYDRSEMIMADDDKKLSKKQREVRAKKRQEWQRKWKGKKTIEWVCGMKRDQEEREPEENAVAGGENGDETGMNEEVVDDASLPGPVEMEPPAAVTLSEGAQLPSKPILSQGLQRALARSAPRPITDEDNQQRLVALQNKVFPGTHLLPQEVAPAMRLGKPIPPPLKKVKGDEIEKDNENGDEKGKDNGLRKKTLKIKATMRDGKVKNLFPHMHTTVQALIVQAGATAPCSLFHDGRKVAYARSLRTMSRKHSSSFNLGGLKECTVDRRSASRSPSRKVTRNRKKKDEGGRDDGPLLIIDEESPLDIQSVYERDLTDETIYQVEHEGSLALSIYMCSCNPTFNETLEEMGERAARHFGELQARECPHAQAIRAILNDFLREITVIEEGITPISDCPRLFVTIPQDDKPGVVRVTARRITCIVCRKDTCDHVKEMNGSPHLDQEECEEEEEEGEKIPIEWVNQAYKFCPHQEPLHSREKEVVWVDSKGIQDGKVITFLTSSCCRYFTSEKTAFAISEAMVLDIDLLRIYESFLAKNATTLSGYHKSLVDFRDNYGVKTDRVISLSSLSRAWNEYLTRLEIPKEKFGCTICGKYPNAIVCDGIQMGLRANISLEQGLTHGMAVFRESSLPYIGKLYDRNAMLRFLNGEGTLPDIEWPSPIDQLVIEAMDGNTLRPEYRLLMNLIFCNSIIPLLLQTGTRTEAREIIGRIMDGTFKWREEELSLLRLLPTLYSSIKPLLIGSTLPQIVITVLRFVIHQSDILLTVPPYNERYYGPPVETHLEYFPHWPLQRGLTSYTKDKAREIQLECSEKIIGAHRKLSPGLLLITCTHRRPYGFRIMKTPESAQDIFQVLLTRLGDKPPSTVIYDNSCMLATYTLAREPSRFANVKFLIDKFHHYNHKACSQALRIRSYKADPVLSSYNTQACEQTNSLLRHLGNSLPFMTLPRYTKTLILFLSRN